MVQDYTSKSVITALKFLKIRLCTAELHLHLGKDILNGEGWTIRELIGLIGLDVS